MRKDDKIRVSRGGSWCSAPAGARVAARGWIESSDRDLYFGFRLARVQSPLEMLAVAGKEVPNDHQA